MWNPHHPRFFLHEDDDAGAPHPAGAAGHAASAGNASAPRGGTGAWPIRRTPARNTAGHGNTGGRHGKICRSRRNAGKATGRWPRPPIWRTPGGRGKKTGGAAPGAFGVCGTRFEGPKLPASDLHLLYPNDRQMATAAGNTSGRGSSPYASTILRYVDVGEERKTEDGKIRPGGAILMSRGGSILVGVEAPGAAGAYPCADGQARSAEARRC